MDQHQPHHRHHTLFQELLEPLVQQLILDCFWAMSQSVSMMSLSPLLGDQWISLFLLCVQLYSICDLNMCKQLAEQLYKLHVGTLPKKSDASRCGALQRPHHLGDKRYRRGVRLM
eukprot:3206881-Amphidinium_carterae.1